MASRQPSITQNPNWNKAQRTFFERLDAALPIIMGYMSDEIPIIDNHTTQMLVDEVGDLKRVKKALDKAEKAHVERLKVRMGSLPSLKGDLYEATFRGSTRSALNQGACKELLEKADNEGIDLNKLLDAIAKGDFETTQNIGLSDGECNLNNFYSSTNTKALYVEEM